MPAKNVVKESVQAITGKDPLLGVRVPYELSKAIDAWAKRHGHTRASAILLFIEMGLKRKG